MPVFVAAIGGMLLNIVGSMVGRIFVALGMVVMTYKGLDSGTSQNPSDLFLTREA